MQIFAVIGILPEQQDDIVRLAKQAYTDPNVYPIGNGVFVASNGKTAQEVSVRLGIGDGSEGANYTGIVVTVNYYWGRYAKELWEWIASRSSANGS